MFCQNCGKEIPEGAAFCGNCGTKIGELSSDGVNEKPEQNNSQNVPENSDDEDAFEDAYITGSLNTPYNTNGFIHFKNAFSKFKVGLIANFNLPALLTGYFYMLYRKNYIAVIVSLVALTVDSLLTHGVLSLFFCLVSGFLCDYITWKRYKSTVAVAKLMYPDDKEMQLSYVALKGGTNGGATVIAVIICIILVTIIAELL